METLPVETPVLEPEAQFGVDWRRVGIYCGIAYGLAIVVGTVVYILSRNVQPFDPNAQTISLIITLLVAGGYMWAPGLAHIFTRLITKEGFRGIGLHPNFRKGWKFWLLAWILPVAISLLGTAVYYLFFPAYYDGGMSMVVEQYRQAGMGLNVTPLMVLGIQLMNVMLIAPVINSFATLGEEFGWRAYLLPKLMPLGPAKAMLISGVIWGAWHWPLTLQGHNYGLEYWGAPWLGMLVMLVFTFSLGTLFSWLSIRGGSVWPAVIGHAMLNGVGGIGVLWMTGSPNLLFGPIVAGLVAGLPFTLLAVYLIWRRKPLMAAQAA